MSDWLTDFTWLPAVCECTYSIVQLICPHDISKYRYIQTLITDFLMSQVEITYPQHTHTYTHIALFSTDSNYNFLSPRVFTFFDPVQYIYNIYWIIIFLLKFFHEEVTPRHTLKFSFQHFSCPVEIWEKCEVEGKEREVKEIIKILWLLALHNFTTNNPFAVAELLP